jgi:hypothetical protein
VLADHRQCGDVGGGFEFFAQGLGQITHLVKVAGSPLVDPAEKLRGPETFLAQTLAKNGQTFQIEFEKVGRHGVYAEFANGSRGDQRL